MIVTKSQLIIILLSGFSLNPRIIKRIQFKYRQLREDLFLEQCRQELNFNLEPIRKNLYIIH